MKLKFLRKYSKNVSFCGLNKKCRKLSPSNLTFWKLDTSRAFTEAITADRELEAKAATVEVGKIGEAAKLQKVN